jgi:hypothetical protein
MHEAHVSDQADLLGQKRLDELPVPDWIVPEDGRVGYALLLPEQG